MPKASHFLRTPIVMSATHSSPECTPKLSMSANQSSCDETKKLKWTGYDNHRLPIPHVSLAFSKKIDVF